MNAAIYRHLAVIFAGVVLLFGTLTPIQSEGLESQPSGEESAANPPVKEEAPGGDFHRFELRTAKLETRYRCVDTIAGDTKTHHEYRTSLEVRLALDQAGRFNLNAGMFFGGNFTAGWNSTGIGPGGLDGKNDVKETYLSAEFLPGVQLEYGGLPILGGQSTEITTCHNDAYPMGQRLGFRRANHMFFDETCDGRRRICPRRPRLRSV